MKVMSLALVGLLLAACSPAYDWREVNDMESGYSITFPDKPVKVSRPMTIAGESVELTLQSAKVGDGYFAVGTVPLTPAQMAKSGPLLDTLRLAMQNNIGVKETPAKTVTTAGVAWQEVLAQGQMTGGRPALLHARFAVIGSRLMEVIAMGDPDRLPVEVRDQWFGSLRLQSPKKTSP